MSTQLFFSFWLIYEKLKKFLFFVFAEMKYLLGLIYHQKITASGKSLKFCPTCFPLTLFFGGHFLTLEGKLDILSF